jgi:hypothetical protein
MIKKLKTSFEHISIAKHLIRWTLLTIPVAFIVGSLVALFLWLLDKVTELRWQHGWLLYFLPHGWCIDLFRL